MNGHFLQALAVLAGVVIIFRVDPIINAMGPACRVPVRIAFVSLMVGAVGLVLSITQGFRPNLATVLLALGVAVLLLVERRVRGLLRKGPQPLGFDRRRNR